MNNKKTNIFKTLFIGQEPTKRKHAPKIIEHVHFIIGNLINILIFLIYFIILFSKSDNFLNYFWIFFNSIISKIFIAFLIGNYLSLIATTSRLWVIQKKVEQGKMIVFFESLFSLLIVTSPIAIAFSLLGLKYNEIEFV